MANRTQAFALLRNEVIEKIAECDTTLDVLRKKAGVVLNRRDDLLATLRVIDSLRIK